jgi:hypothetical protein
MELLGQRVVLRPAAEGDLDFYVALRNNADVISWTGAGGPRERSDVERDLGRWGPATNGPTQRRARSRLVASSTRRTGTKESRPRPRSSWSTIASIASDSIVSSR